MIAPKDKYTSVLQGLPLGLAGVLLLWIAVVAPYYHTDLLAAHPSLIEILDDVRAPAILLSLCVVSLIAGLMALAVLVLLRLTVGEVEIWEWGTMQ